MTVDWILVGYFAPFGIVMFIITVLYTKGRINTFWGIVVPSVLMTFLGIYGGIVVSINLGVPDMFFGYALLYLFWYVEVGNEMRKKAEKLFKAWFNEKGPTADFDQME